MKKPHNIEEHQKYTILAQPAYWRLRAEMLAIQDLLEQAYLGSLGIEPGCKEYSAGQEIFQKTLKQAIAVRHQKLLSELETHSPELAARLDNRDIGDVEPI